MAYTMKQLQDEFLGPPWLAAHHAEDWCHLCGTRTSPTVDVWYPENAELDDEVKGLYLRICEPCAKRIWEKAVAARKDAEYNRLIQEHLTSPGPSTFEI